MVDFHNPVTMARDGAAAINLWHTTDGIFIWEFFTTLNYEWDVIQGRRPYRWTIWVYSLTRLTTLIAVVLNMFGFDNTLKIDCQPDYNLNNFFAFFAFGSASLLIVLRVTAVWNRARIIVLIAMGVWLADVAFLIYGTAVIRAAWSDERGSCVLLNPHSNKINVVASLVSDVILLLLMVVGLLRLRLETRTFGLGHILWNQSLVWLLLTTVAEVPPAVFFCLNLNDGMSIMFEGPNMVIMAIAATRMYRSLINLGTAEVTSEAPGASRPVSKLRFRSQPVPLKRLKRMAVQVSSQTDTDRYPTPQSKVEAQTPVQTRTG